MWKPSSYPHAGHLLNPCSTEISSGALAPVGCLLTDRGRVAHVFGADGTSTAIAAEEFKCLHLGFADMFFVAYLFSTVGTGINLPHFRGVAKVPFPMGHLPTGLALIRCHENLLLLGYREKP